MTEREAAKERNATRIVDRGGRRVRLYIRNDPSRPGQQERRQRRADGERWCRGCRRWSSPEAFGRQGACRVCSNREWREQYAKNPEGIRRRVHARKRWIAPLPALAAELLLEQFDGRCADCPADATTWDHLRPVARGGQTEPGNVVPACVRCNSSKRSTPLLDWLQRSGRAPDPALWDVLALDPIEVE